MNTDNIVKFNKLPSTRKIRSEAWRGCKNPSWKGGLVKFYCELCGKLAETKACEIKKGKRHFCSRECYLNWVSKKVEVVCENCGELFRKGECYIERSNRNFCSQRCYGEAIQGKDNSNWRGGIAFYPYSPAFNATLKRWIRERDNHTCRECNQTQKELGYKLHVHHIDYDKENNNPDNLISLCRSCHQQTNFNRDDWTEYYQKLLK